MTEEQAKKEVLPPVYEIQRDWTGLSWETCIRLQSYIAKILDKAQEIAKKERKRELLERLFRENPSYLTGRYKAYWQALKAELEKE